MTRHRTVDDRKRVRGAGRPTYRFVVDGGVYLAVKHRHGTALWWHVFEAERDAAGRGRLGAHITAARTLNGVPGAIAAWQASGIEEVA